MSTLCCRPEEWQQAHIWWQGCDSAAGQARCHETVQQQPLLAEWILGVPREPGPNSLPPHLQEVKCGRGQLLAILPLDFQVFSCKNCFRLAFNCYSNVYGREEFILRLFTSYRNAMSPDKIHCSFLFFVPWLVHLHRVVSPQACNTQCRGHCQSHCEADRLSNKPIHANTANTNMFKFSIIYNIGTVRIYTKQALQKNNSL